MTTPTSRTALILVVDDREAQRYLAAMALRRAGWDVAEAGSGEAALEVIEERVPQLVVVDFHMGGMTGLDLLVRLRQSPATAAIPVVLVSAHFEDVELADRARAAGAAEVLILPHPEALAEAVRRALLASGTG